MLFVIKLEHIVVWFESKLKIFAITGADYAADFGRRSSPLAPEGKLLSRIRDAYSDLYAAARTDAESLPLDLNVYVGDARLGLFVVAVPRNDGAENRRAAIDEITSDGVDPRLVNKEIQTQTNIQIGRYVQRVRQLSRDYRSTAHVHGVIRLEAQRVFIAVHRQPKPAGHGHFRRSAESCGLRDSEIRRRLLDCPDFGLDIWIRCALAPGRRRSLQARKDARAARV